MVSWRFPEIVVPPVIIHVQGNKNHPFGVPPFGVNPPAVETYSQARKLEFHFGEAHQDPAKMKRMKPWLSTIHAGSGKAKNFDFLEAGKLQCMLPETWMLFFVMIFIGMF